MTAARQNGTSTSRDVYRTVIAAHDGHEPSSDGLALARLVAGATGARLLIAHVAPPRVSAADGPRLTRGRALREQDDVARLLERLLHDLAPELRADTRLVTCRSVPRALHDLAVAEGADLVVLGSSRHGPVGRVLTGSVSGPLIQGAPCAVAVAPRGFSGLGAQLHRLAVAFDGSPESKVALRHATSLAVAAGARLRLIAAVEPLVFPAFVNVPAGDAYAEIIHARGELLEREVESARAALPPGLPVETRILDGSAVDAICKGTQYGVDLLVVGSRGFGPVRRVLLGSVSSRLLHVAPCPVLVVPRGADAAEAAIEGRRRSPPPARLDRSHNRDAPERCPRTARRTCRPRGDPAGRISDGRGGSLSRGRRGIRLERPQDDRARALPHARGAHVLGTRRHGTWSDPGNGRGSATSPRGAAVAARRGRS